LGAITLRPARRVKLGSNSSTRLLGTGAALVGTRPDHAARGTTAGFDASRLWRVARAEQGRYLPRASSRRISTAAPLVRETVASVRGRHMALTPQPGGTFEGTGGDAKERIFSRISARSWSSTRFGSSFADTPVMVRFPAPPPFLPIKDNVGVQLGPMIGPKATEAREERRRRSPPVGSQLRGCTPRSC